MNNSIFNNLYTGDISKLLCSLEESLLNREKEFIITANSEIVSSNDKEIIDILSNKKNTVICDGIALTKIASIKNSRKYHRIPGVELTFELLDLAHIHKSKVYIYGSSLANLIELDKVIKDRFAGIKLVGMKDGYNNSEEDIKLDIIENRPDIIIVALGVPKQELFLNSIKKELNKGLLIGVGGSLDIISGSKKRAPKIMIKFHLEWLYRIYKEPRRFSRFLKSNLKFLSKIKKM